MTFLTQKSLPRRTFLRGAGAALALPMLDSMIPALRAATKAPPRLAFVYVSHGVIWEQWKPKKVGYDFDITPNLKPVEALKDQFNIPQRPVAPGSRHQRRRQRRPHARLGRLAHRRARL